mmetsp:Transcript_87675/g.253210  ORF Transcript_87675/g.253210 Transcript_87675/m.253210 type:complete len:474 (+) Transcript_87675:432-1853(+)
MEPDLRLLELGAVDPPMLVPAKAVRTAKRHRGGAGLRHSRPQDLLIVPVAQNLKLLEAPGADLEACLVHSLLPEGRHRLQVPRRPRATDEVATLRRGEIVLRRKLRPGDLPRDRWRVVPSETNAVARSGALPFPAAVDKPMSCDPLVVWTQDPRRRVGLVAGRVKGALLVAVDEQVEAFPRCVAEDDVALECAILLPLHLLRFRPTAPSADDIHAVPVGLRGPQQVAEDVAPSVAIAAVVIAREVLSHQRAMVLLRRRVVGNCDAAEPAHRAQAPRASDLDVVDLLGEGLGSVRRAAPEVGAAVRAAKAEGRHADDVTGAAAVRRLGGHEGREPVQVQVRAQRDEVVVRGSIAVGATQDALGEPGHACVGLGVTEVDLARREGERRRSLPLRAEDAHQRAELDRVPQRSAGTMTLRRADHVRCDLRHPHGLLNDRLLGWTVGRRQAGAPAVLVQTGADALGVPGVPVSLLGAG